MEKGGGGGGSVGPTNSQSHSHSNSHSRPVRAASRYFYGGGGGGHSTNSSSSPATFSGPVRRWEKKWVHVSSSQPSSTTTTTNNNNNPPKPRKFFLCNGPSKPPDSPILLRKWTPLSRPPSSDHHHLHHSNVADSRRKFRYTPITVFEERKKPTAKGVADGDNSREADKSAERAMMDGEDIYGLLDINNDLMGARQGSGECDLIYSRRSHLNLGLHMENKNKDLQPDLNIRGLWATN